MGDGDAQDTVVAVVEDLVLSAAGNPGHRGDACEVSYSDQMVQLLPTEVAVLALESHKVISPQACNIRAACVARPCPDHYFAPQELLFRSVGQEHVLLL
jgi:hypothetical protein